MSQAVGTSYRNPREKQANEPQPGRDSAKGPRSQVGEDLHKREHPHLTGTLDLHSLMPSPFLKRKNRWRIIRVIYSKVEKRGKKAHLGVEEQWLASNEVHYSKKLNDLMEGQPAWNSGVVILSQSPDPLNVSYFYRSPI